MMLLTAATRAAARRYPRHRGSPLAQPGGVEPAAMLEQARRDLADAARHIRRDAPDKADEMLAEMQAAVRTAARTLAPERRRGPAVRLGRIRPPRPAYRQRARRWPLWLLVVASVAALIALLARALAPRLSGSAARVSRLTAGSMPATGEPAPRWPAQADAGTPVAAHPPELPTPDPEAEAAFDRDAEIRAATEGMEAPERPLPGMSRTVAATRDGAL